MWYIRNKITISDVKVDRPRFPGITQTQTFKYSLPKTPVGSDYFKRLFYSSVNLLYICYIHRNYGNTKSTLKILVGRKNI